MVEGECQRGFVGRQVVDCILRRGTATIQLHVHPRTPRRHVCAGVHARYNRCESRLLVGIVPKASVSRQYAARRNGGVGSKGEQESTQSGNCHVSSRRLQPEGGGGVQGDQAGIDDKENLGGCDVFYGASLDPQLSFTIVYVNFTAMNKTFSKHQ